MPVTKTQAQPQGSRLKMLLSIVAAIVISIFLVVKQINFVAGRALLIAFGHTEATYRGASVEWDGDVVAKDVVIMPFGEREADADIRFERLHVTTPGWWYLLRSAFSRKLFSEPMHRLTLRLEGGDSVSGFDPTLGDFGPFSVVTASPFEAQGCREDDLWTFDELREMGLSPGPATLIFDYELRGTALASTITLEVPGVSRVMLERSETLEAPVDALLLDAMPTRTSAETWTVTDAGFVAARNRHCARKDGVPALTFVERHVTSVARLLETAGLAADPALHEAYRAFARDGGTLRFLARYPQPLHSDVYYDARADGRALRGMDAIVERGSARAAVPWRIVAARELAGIDEMPTWAAIEREQSGRAAAVAAAAELGGAAPAEVALTAPEASSPVVGDAAAVTTEAPGPSEQAASVEIPWSKLGGHVGHVVRLEAVGQRPRLVEVLAAGPELLKVKALMRSGHFDYEVPRERFVRAEGLR